MYYLESDTLFSLCIRATIHDSKYGVLFASTYTAKQLKTLYYSHSYLYCIKVWYFRLFWCKKVNYYQIILIFSSNNHPCITIGKSRKFCMHNSRICAHRDRCTFWKTHGAQLCSTCTPTQNGVNNGI